MNVQPLKYKENWPESRERFLALWEHEIIDRACIGVTVTKGNAPVLLEGPDAEAEIADPEFHIRRLNAWFYSYWHGGEALPTQDSILNYAVFGGDPIFQKTDWIANTLWIEPIIHDWDTDVYQFDPNNKWAQHSLEMKRLEYIDSRGKYLPALEGVYPPTEELTFLRGSSELAMDLMLEPERVKKTQRSLLDAYKWFNGQRFEIIHSEEEGNVSLGMWAPGRFMILHCDFSCLISTAQFREFVLPELEELSNWFDYTIYHLDGPDARRHLPALLELDGFDVVQYSAAPWETEPEIRTGSSSTRTFRPAAKSHRSTLGPVVSSGSWGNWIRAWSSSEPVHHRSRTP